MQVQPVGGGGGLVSLEFRVEISCQLCMDALHVENGVGNMIF